MEIVTPHYVVKMYDKFVCFRKVPIHSGLPYTRRIFARKCDVGGRGFDPRPRHTKDVIKMVPDASLLGAQHIRTSLAPLSSQTSLKKEMDTIRNERSRVINISWDNLFRSRPKINKFKSENVIEI